MEWNNADKRVLDVVKECFVPDILEVALLERLEDTSILDPAPILMGFESDRHPGSLHPIAWLPRPQPLVRIADAESIFERDGAKTLEIDPS